MFRLGRDLKSKVSMESGSDDEEEHEKEEKKMSVSEMIKVIICYILTTLA